MSKISGYPFWNILIYLSVALQPLWNIAAFSVS
jgi:hypothetical protein